MARRKKKAKPVQKVYIGPSIPGLTTNTIFLGDYPPHVKDIIEKWPAIAGLIVSLNVQQEARKNLKVPGNLYNIKLKRLKEELKNGL